MDISAQNFECFYPLYISVTTVQVAYTTTTYAGFVGAITGYVPNLFTISGDERDKGSLLDNLKALAKGDEFAFFLEREVNFNLFLQCTSG